MTLLGHRERPASGALSAGELPWHGRGNVFGAQSPDLNLSENFKQIACGRSGPQQKQKGQRLSWPEI